MHEGPRQEGEPDPKPDYIKLNREIRKLTEENVRIKFDADKEIRRVKEENVHLRDLKKQMEQTLPELNEEMRKLTQENELLKKQFEKQTEVYKAKIDHLNELFLAHTNFIRAQDQAIRAQATGIQKLLGENQAIVRKLNEQRTRVEAVERICQRRGLHSPRIPPVSSSSGSDDDDETRVLSPIPPPPPLSPSPPPSPPPSSTTSAMSASARSALSRLNLKPLVVPRGIQIKKINGSSPRQPGPGILYRYGARNNGLRAEGEGVPKVEPQASMLPRGKTVIRVEKVKAGKN